MKLFVIVILLKFLLFFQSGLPSLILDLLTITNGRYESGLMDKFDKLMNCGKIFHSFGNNILTQDSTFFSKSNCKFPGSDIFRLMHEFESVNKRVDKYLYDVQIHKAWLTEYNVRHNISNPYRINEGW